jgi:hypothetical protein
MKPRNDSQQSRPGQSHTKVAVRAAQDAAEDFGNEQGLPDERDRAIRESTTGPLERPIRRLDSAMNSAARWFPGVHGARQPVPPPRKRTVGLGTRRDLFVQTPVADMKQGGSHRMQGGPDLLRFVVPDGLG